MGQFDIGANWKDRGLRSKLAFFVAIVWSLYTLSYLCNVFFYLGQFGVDLHPGVSADYPKEGHIGGEAQVV